VRALLFPHRIAVIVALGLCQIGEFSFVLIQIGKMYHVIDAATYQIIIAASILTMALTPLFINLAPRVGRKVDFREDREGKSVSGQLRDHVIIVGYGLAGRHLARVLKAAGLSYIILELNGTTVRRAKLLGEPILFGDASRLSILDRCGIHSAHTIVFVISDPLAVRQGVKLARHTNPKIFIIARARMMTEIEELRTAGADDVVSEEFETSIEIFTSVLTRLRVPGNIIRSQTALLRTNNYSIMRSPAPLAYLSENITRALSLGTIDNFLVTNGMKVAGMTIAELDLRRATGAMILALVRDDIPQTNPMPETRIAANDILVLVGSHSQMESAFHYLEQNSESETR
jgi:CPA2 family monovalent cation:H+ antiporter-2